MPTIFKRIIANSYQNFENGTGSLTDEVAYRILGKIAFTHAVGAFRGSSPLRVCDIGCFLGSSSVRWLTMGQALAADQSQVQVVGLDIYESNIQKATETYRHLTDIQFRAMLRGGAIPRIENRGYHLLFAAFVIDTITSFEDVSVLCEHMVESLEPHGKIYVLRLHPNGVKSKASFHDYHIESRANWQHGDPLNIQISNQESKTIHLEDTFWETSRICDIFTSLRCESEPLSVSTTGLPSMQEYFTREVLSLGLPLEMVEWHVPLYQIIQVKKQ